MALAGVHMLLDDDEVPLRELLAGDAEALIREARRRARRRRMSGGRRGGPRRRDGRVSGRGRRRWRLRQLARRRCRRRVGACRRAARAGARGRGREPPDLLAADDRARRPACWLRADRARRRAVHARRREDRRRRRLLRNARPRRLVAVRERAAGEPARIRRTRRWLPVRAGALRHARRRALVVGGAGGGDRPRRGGRRPLGVDARGQLPGGQRRPRRARLPAAPARVGRRRPALGAGAGTAAPEP